MRITSLLTTISCISASLVGAADFMYGTTMHYFWDELPFEESQRIMKEGGHNAFRTENSWNRAVDKNGNWQIYHRVDTALKLAAENKISPLVLLCGTSPKIENNFPHGKYIPAWLEYVDGVTKLLNGKTKLIQVWNEWDGGHMMSVGRGKINTPANYVELLKQTYPVIKKNCPDAAVLSNSFCTGEDFLYKCFELGMQQYCDAYTIHIYNWNWTDPELMYPGMLRREEMSAKYNNGKALPFYITEFGWLSNINAITEAKQADYLCRFILLARSVKSCRGVFSYNFQDRGEDWQNKELFWGLQMRDLTPKESFFAVRSAANLVNNAEFVKRIDVGNPDVWLFQFKKDDGSTTLAAWTVDPEVRQHIVLKKEGADAAPILLERCGNPVINRTWGFLDQSVSPRISKPANPDQFSFHVTTRPVLLHNVPEGFSVDYIRTVYNPVPKESITNVPRVFAVIPPTGGSFDLAGGSNWVNLIAKDPYSGPQDLSCRTTVTYDLNNLHLKFTVKDNAIVTAGKDERNWEFDSIQMSFSKLANGQAQEKIYTDYMISLVGDKTSLVTRNNNDSVYRKKTQAKAQVKRISNNTLEYTISIPYAEIHTSYDSVQAGNDPVGFTFIVNDNDGKGRKGFLSWGRGIGSGWNLNGYGWLYFAQDASRNYQEIGFPHHKDNWKTSFDGKGAVFSHEKDGNWNCFKMNVSWEKEGDVTAYCSYTFPTPVKNFKEMLVTCKNDSKSQLLVRYVDGTGQYFQYRYAIEPSESIQTISCRFDNHMFKDQKAFSVWGGAGDKVWHEPLTRVIFVLDSATWSMSGSHRTANESTLKIGNVQILTE